MNKATSSFGSTAARAAAGLAARLALLLPRVRLNAR